MLLWPFRRQVGRLVAANRATLLRAPELGGVPVSQPSEHTPTPTPTPSVNQAPAPAGERQAPAARITRRVSAAGERRYWVHSIGGRPLAAGPVGPFASATLAAVCAAERGAASVVWAWGRAWAAREPRPIPRGLVRGARL